MNASKIILLPLCMNPYMAFAVLDRLVKDKDIQLDYTTAEKNYIKSICKGSLFQKKKHLLLLK